MCPGIPSTYNTVRTKIPDSDRSGFNSGWNTESEPEPRNSRNSEPEFATKEPTERNGPTALWKALLRVNQPSNARIRTLTEQLKTIQLKDFPGENCELRGLLQGSASCGG